MKSPSKGAILWLLVIFGPPLIGGILYLVAAEHKIMPGINGCSYVRDGGKQIDCFADEILGFARTNDTATTLAMVESKAKEIPALASSCHLALHQYGEPEGRRDAKAGATLQSLGDAEWCSEGYIHGYYIGYLAEVGSDASAAAAISRVCSQLPNEQAVYNCTHSYGHALARNTNNDRVAAAKGCEALKLDGAELERRARIDCVYGQYMEYTLADLAKGRTTPVDNCKDAPDSAKPGCYAFLPARAARIAGDDLAGGRACSEHAPKGEVRTMCVENYARTTPNDDACAVLSASADRSHCISIRKDSVKPS